MRPNTEKYPAKIPFPVTCHQRKEPYVHKFHMDKTSFDWTCPFTDYPFTRVGLPSLVIRQQESDVVSIYGCNPSQYPLVRFPLPAQTVDDATPS